MANTTRKDYTYYMIGNRIAEMHETTTNIKDDYVFLCSDPEARVYGMHMNKQRWTLIRDEYIKEYDEYISARQNTDKPPMFGFESLKIVSDEDPFVKVILMHELVGAV